MANFVDGLGTESEGYPLINLDRVAVLRPRRCKHGGWNCFDAEGRCLGSIEDYIKVNSREAVIPNTAAITLLSFYEDGDNVSIDRYIVLAWRVDGTHPTPVICDEFHEDDVVYCYEQRIGDEIVFIFPGDRSFTTADEARLYAKTKIFTQRRKRTE